MGRLIVVGDIHGCDVALRTLLDRLQLQPADQFVVLGDAIDRGPQSSEVLELLVQVADSCQLTFVLGNHEEMLLDILAGDRPDRWLQHGGAATLDSYGGDLAAIPERHLKLLGSAVDYWESPSTICIHANLEPGVALADQSHDWLRWQRLTGMEYPHPSGKMVLCGHTGQRSGLPMVGDGWICLDTLAYAGKFLTCLVVDSWRFLQASQIGGYREFSLNELIA